MNRKHRNCRGNCWYQTVSIAMQMHPQGGHDDWLPKSEWAREHRINCLYVRRSTGYKYEMPHFSEKHMLKVHNSGYK
jgi:hypothetical protein